MPGALLVLATAGCGGGGSTTTTTTVAVRTNTPYKAALCLNESAFLVEAAGKTIEGSSPGGVNFTATFYPSAAAARRALGRMNPDYAKAIAATVIDYSGNPPIHLGGQPMILINNDLRTLRHCIELRRPG